MDAQQGITLSPEQLRWLITTYGQNPQTQQQQSGPLQTGIASKMGTMLFGGNMVPGVESSHVQGVLPYLGDKTGISDMLGFGNSSELIGPQLPTPGAENFIGPTAPETSSLTAALPYLQSAAGAYGMYKGAGMIRDANKVGGRKGAIQGSLGGLAGGLGAAALLGLGPLGVAALVAGGALAGTRLGDKNRFQDEYNKLSKLKDQGYNVGELGPKPKMGRSTEQLVAEEQAKLDSGQWGNVDFAQNRKESSLTPQDIQGYAALYEKAGKNGTLQDRMALAQKALAAGAVREHHGTVDVDWTKVDAGQTPSVQQVSPATAAALTQPSKPAIDAGTQRRWRMNRGQAGFSGR